MDRSRIFLQCLAQLVKPLMRFCLKHDIKIQQIIECCKQQLLSAATDELIKADEIATASRLSVMTGLQRRDITRLLTTDARESGQSLVAKVLGLWVSAKRYRSADGTPRRLTLDEFYQVAASVSRDLNPKNILTELIRIGSVALDGESVRIVRSSYVPVGDLEAGFKIASHDLADLLEAVDENLATQPVGHLPHHHLRTEFDRIRGDALPEIRKWLLMRGKEFHLKAREYLAAYDQDVNPEQGFGGKVCRVAISSFAKSSTSEKEI